MTGEVAGQRIVRNQMIRVRLFVRCVIIGLTLDDVAYVRAPEHEGTHRQNITAAHLYVLRTQQSRRQFSVADHRPHRCVQWVEKLLM